ncbi:response regulator [Roseomonas sp. KE2513]|uniref:response regulator n=1 Tax=Roseomonas sp. KE2513 TaxID=2479202 RepID=UPI0018DFFB61|nr:response regulator [Roseomonas sp. KE2513]MBI0535918.1 response regulator [Roseomonas sp. KE2513]
MTPSLPRMLADRSVLIVEDQYLIADELRTLVERLGGRVLGPVGQVAAAIRLLAEEKPDLALLDVNLDGEEVYTVAEALSTAGVPFVFATGYDSWIIDPRFSDTPLLEKPVALPALVAALEELKLS